jgi:hypothetical protein
LRRQQNTRRSLMLVEMYGTLTPVQRARLATVGAADALPCVTHAPTASRADLPGGGPH